MTDNKRKTRFRDILILLVLFCLVSSMFPLQINVSGEEPEQFNNTENLGWELLDNNSVLHMWNQHNDYYFNVSNGIQFGNHYQEYWTQNVLMLGYYDGDEWNLIYRTDELSGFNKNITGETDDYINATIWKDMSYGSYDFRLAIRYNLGVNDSDLTIIPYIKNLGIEIPYVLGFGWEMKDIQIANVTNDNYLWIGNNTLTEKILLNQTLDKSWNDLENNTKINLVCTEPPSPYLSRNLYLKWNYTLNYKVTVKSRVNQYNAPTTLFVRIGTLLVGQEKYTEMNWLDADDWLGISSTELIDNCGDSYGAGWDVVAALDGTGVWYHDVTEVHWFVLDLGQTYTIKKLQGRGGTFARDPIDVNIYIDDNNPPTTLIEEGISTWQDTTEWVEIDITDSDGRYIKVEIEGTEAGSPGYIIWGITGGDDNIFDAYGDVAGPPANNPPTQTGESPTNESIGVGRTPDLYVSCADADSDYMNASWYSNSSNSWVWFGGNSTFLDANITQPNSNFSAYDTTYYWSLNLTDGEDWNNETYHFTTLVNTPPVSSNPVPANRTTNQVLSLSQLNITINDANGDTTIGTIETFPGIGDDFWTGQPNGTQICNVSGLSYSTNYTWYAYFSDGTTIVNNSFWFVTVANTIPTQTGESPTNQSTTVDVSGGVPDLYVICNDANNDNLNATWWSNSSSSWAQFASNWTSFANNTNITQSNANFSTELTKYWWSVNLSDGTDWNNETYHFTTASNATIDTEIFPTTWLTGNVDVGTNIQENFTFWQNGSATIDITIGVNGTNFTFVNYASWLNLGHDRFCANFTNNSWTTEYTIEPGYPPSSVLNSSFATGNFAFGIRIWMPRTVSYSAKQEDFDIVLVISESS